MGSRRRPGVGAKMDDIHPLEDDDADVRPAVADVRRSRLVREPRIPLRGLSLDPL